MPKITSFDNILPALLTIACAEIDKNTREERGDYGVLLYTLQEFGIVDLSKKMLIKSDEIRGDYERTFFSYKGQFFQTAGHVTTIREKYFTEITLLKKYGVINTEVDYKSRIQSLVFSAPRNLSAIRCLMMVMFYHLKSTKHSSENLLTYKDVDYLNNLYINISADMDEIVARAEKRKIITRI